MDAANPYRVGLEFQDELTQMDDVFESPAETVAAPVEGERRRRPRVDPLHAELDVRAWSTVAFRDLSLGGVMFASARPLDRGTRAQLHTRLGALGFAAEIEVKRVESHTTRLRGYGIGAAFVSMDDDSRSHLAAFLAAPEN